MGNNNDLENSNSCNNNNNNNVHEITLMSSGSSSVFSSSKSLLLPDNNNHEDNTPPPSDNFPPGSLKKSFSYNTLNARAQSFLPRTGSMSSLHNIKKIAPPPLVLPPRSPITLAATTTTQKTSFVIPHPPGPPTLLHVFTTTTSLPSPTSPGPAAMFPPPHSPGHYSPRPSSMFPSPLSPGNYSPRPAPIFPPPLSPGHYSPRPAPIFPPPLSPGHFSPGPGGRFVPPPLSPVGFHHQDILAAVVALSPRPMSPAAVVALTMPPQCDLAKEAGGAAGMFGRISKLLDEVSKKVLHQVEYYFSDLNVATTDHLIKYMNKDPEGYVPLSIVASFKKIRTTTNSNAQLANILRNSDKLIVSDDGKRVKRVKHLTESYMEELQSRIVVAENLPDDHCHQNLMRIFSAVGSVKAIRTCQPSASNGVVSSASRTANSGVLRQSNKLHAFVEYESIELAEKAVAQLSDKKNWRNGLRVRFLIKSQVKSSLARSLKVGHDNGSGGISPTESEGDDEGEQKKPRGRGWGKGRPQYQPPNSRGSIMGCPQNAHIASNNEQHATIKQTRVPRMPDGTRGFSMGRGKMIAARTA